MRELYLWIRSIVSFMILMTVLFNLLPGKKYEKYLQLFSGIVLALLMFRPLTDLTGAERQMAEAFERITFQTDTRLLEKEIIASDEERLYQLVEQYRRNVQEEWRKAAQCVEADCESVELMIDEDPQSMTFGNVKEAVVRFRTASSAGKDRMLEIRRQMQDFVSMIGEIYGMEERNITVTLETQ